MATKASGTLVLIIEKQHASWDLMCSTVPALELRFRRQPHIGPPHGPPRPSGVGARLASGGRLAHAPYWWFVHV